VVVCLDSIVTRSCVVKASAFMREDETTGINRRGYREYAEYAEKKES